MIPRKLFAAFVVVVLLMVLLTAAESPRQESQGRYKLVSAQILEQMSGKSGISADSIPVVFLVDEQNGQVWRYQSYSTVKLADGSEKPMPDSFFPVVIREGNTLKTNLQK